MSKEIVIIPVYNEERHIRAVVEELRRHFLGDVLIVDDGSVDNSGAVLSELTSNSVKIVTHETNLGYGASLITGFNYALQAGYQSLVSMDCDWQHEPQYVQILLAGLGESDVVSGSRYLKPATHDIPAPPDREEINRRITALINSLTGFNLTDAFCGFKAYRVACLAGLELDETGYGFPLQFWLQAARRGLRVKEVPVPRIYLDLSRAFPGVLHNAATRLSYYFETIERERKKWNMQPQ